MSRKVEIYLGKAAEVERVRKLKQRRIDVLIFRKRERIADNEVGEILRRNRTTLRKMNGSDPRDSQLLVGSSTELSSSTDRFPNS